MQTYDWLSQGENIIFESAASKVWNVKGINLGGNKGGKLILTDKQLVFQAYAFNIGTRLDKIPLENITGTAKNILSVSAKSKYDKGRNSFRGKI